MTGAEMVIAANGWWFGSIVFVILWILIAFWPAWALRGRGQLFRLLPLQLTFFPAALIVAYVVSDRAQPAVA